MRLSTVFELLLIFLFIAFAASKHVDKKHGVKKHDVKQTPVTKPTTGPNRYCQCSSLMCNCCRDFSLPVVSLKGPGCANIAYMNGDSMRLTMTFGDRILRNITLSGKKPRPVCMGLPGGESKFCGRIYGIQREGDQFKACLALELRSEEDVEAALRVSCFRFGPDGVKLEPGRPVPTDTDDYDDDDDDYDDDDDDDDDFGLADDDDDDDAENDVDSGDDYVGFSALSDEFLEGFFGSSGEKKKKKKPAQVAPQKATTGKPISVTKKPVALAAAPSTVKTLPKATTTVAPTPQIVTEKLAAESTSPHSSSSSQMSVTVLQDGRPIESVMVKTEDTTSSPATTEEMVTVRFEDVTKPEQQGTQEMTDTTQLPPTEDEREEDELDDEDDDSEEEEEGESPILQGEGSTEKDKTESKEDDEDENILDGILEDDDDDDKPGEDDDDEEEDFRQFRSNLPRDGYRVLTPEEQERKFPGLSALIRPQLHAIVGGQQERMFPGLAALLRPSPPTLAQEAAFDFPAVRSARTHRRMRLPPLPTDSH